MINTTRRRMTSYETRMLAMADRLFTEFDDVPVGDVLRAIADARSVLRDGGSTEPERVEDLARNRLARPTDRQAS